MKNSWILTSLLLCLVCITSQQGQTDLNASPVTAPRVSKSTGSFEFKTSIQKAATATGFVYKVEVQIYELSALENFDLRLLPDAPAILIFEGPTTRKSSIWEKTFHVETPTEEARLIIEARGTIEGSPVGDSRPILLHEAGTGAVTKTPSKAIPGFFPPGTQF